MTGSTSHDTATDAHSSNERGAHALGQYLFVTLSYDRPLEGGSRHALNDLDVVVIQRAEARGASRQVTAGTRQLALGVPGKLLSATHARLVRTGSKWVLEDCHSTNGSFVNGERVERAVLCDGDAIELGRTLLVYRDALPSPKGTALDLDTSRTAAEPGLATLVPSLAEELDELTNVAASKLTVLLLGETGSGKEVLARAVHRVSRRSGELVAVNCGAIPEQLVESQLFGHAKGAFSGAVRDEPGLVRAADGGTLFLDEIGDLPPLSQVALLRVLQEGEVLPVGATRPVKVDVRIVAATHRLLASLVETGRFRRDLFARLNGFAYAVPPLRARREDLPILIRALLLRVAPETAASVSFSPAAARALYRYDWPMNVRELEQSLARAAVLSRGGRVERAHFPFEHAEAVGGARTLLSPDDLREQEVMRALLTALDEHEGNISEVARAMGKARMQVHRWMKRFRIDPKAFRR